MELIKLILWFHGMYFQLVKICVYLIHILVKRRENKERWKEIYVMGKENRENSVRRWGQNKDMEKTADEVHPVDKDALEGPRGRCWAMK